MLVNRKSKTVGPAARRGLRIQVLLVDDHPPVRLGVAAWINKEKDMMVCAEAGSAQQALQQIKAHPPQVAVIDISLDNHSGLDLIKDLAAQHPDIKILVLSMHDANLYAERALRAGAAGYVMKSEKTDRVVEGIRAVMGGDIFVSEAFKDRLLLATLNQPARSHALKGLSDRELDVLRLLAEGKSSRAIGAGLHVSPKTVDTHKTRLKKKLGLKNANELMSYAMRKAFPHAAQA